MGFSINTNNDAINTYRNLTNVQSSLSKSLEKLSSGLRINQAGDDAAGLTIANQIGVQVSGLQQAGRNAQDGVSLVQTADGALTQVQSLLGRARDLAVQAANDSNSTTARTAIQTEATSIGDELKRLASAVTFNGTALIDGTASALTFQVGAKNTDNDRITVDLHTVDVGAMGDAIKALTFTTKAGAQAAIDSIDGNIDTVSGARSTIGALENRFASAISTIATSVTNLTAAKSRITDVDMAQEMVNYTRANVLSQSGTAMLAQANSLPQLALKLLG